MHPVSSTDNAAEVQTYTSEREARALLHEQTAPAAAGLGCHSHFGGFNEDSGNIVLLSTAIHVAVRAHLGGQALALTYNGVGQSTNGFAGNGQSPQAWLSWSGSCLQAQPWQLHPP